jgi:hypothetical protein
LDDIARKASAFGWYRRALLTLQELNNAKPLGLSLVSGINKKNS